MPHFKHKKQRRNQGIMINNIDTAVAQLINYAVEKALIPECERIYSTNLILEALHKADYSLEVDEAKAVPVGPLEEILSDLCDYAVENNIIEDSITYRDLFDTKLMNQVMPRPATVIEHFNKVYDVSPERATSYYYTLSQDTNYIRRDRIAKDMKWEVPSVYGDIEITINLSKPEKDPKAIAAARNSASVSYPKCQLCMENEGYAGRLDHPGRLNHRIIPITIAGSDWGFQYSPYVYYNEHCIVFNGQHTPMKISRETFIKLFDFIKLFPHYFLGSNADLPIVGGSILSHDHFQGGHHTFAMAKAESIYDFTVAGFEDIECSIVKWPMSVIRIKSTDSDRLIELASHILDKWRGYSDPESFIYAETDNTPHNTITPIARFVNGKYELDLTLRNNITTDEHPLGVYHPHEKLHHIKKENIGLIEVMGLAVLPSRLKKEMSILSDYILNKKDISSNEDIAKHADWVNEFIGSYPDINKENIDDILKAEIGKVFVQVLEDAGVYKMDDEGMKGFKRFIDTI